MHCIERGLLHQVGWTLIIHHENILNTNTIKDIVWEKKINSVNQQATRENSIQKEVFQYMYYLATFRYCLTKKFKLVYQSGKKETWKKLSKK